VSERKKGELRIAQKIRTMEVSYTQAGSERCAEWAGSSFDNLPQERDVRTNVADEGRKGNGVVA